MGPIIAGAMQGAGMGISQAGELLGGYAVRSLLQEQAAEIEKLRDARLSELKKGEIQFAKDVETKQAIEAGKAAEQAAGTPAYDEGADTARPRKIGRASCRE